jgi:hypothetical protein
MGEQMNPGEKGAGMRGYAVVWSGRLLALTLAGVFPLLALTTNNALAAGVTYTVSGTSDGSGGTCSPADVCTTLRAAVNAANGNPGSTIQLTAQTYQLGALGPLTTESNMTIIGLGAGQTTIEQTTTGSASEVFDNGGTVEIEDVTISGATFDDPPPLGMSGDGGNSNGGGIYNSGSLTLSDDAVTNDSATGGSATGNGIGGGGYGGGVFNAGTLIVEDSSFTNDTATGGPGAGSGYGEPGEGGAIYSYGTLTVDDGSFSRDTATGSDGADGAGGIGGAIANSGGTMAIERSTIGPANSAGGPDGSPDGGGIYTDQATGSAARIVNTTIFGNSAGGVSSPGSGGGVEVGPSSIVSLASDTIDDNSAPGGEGGNLDSSDPATATLSDTIIANGVGTGSTEECDSAGPDSIVDGGNNLESDTTSQCNLAGASKGDLLVADAFLPSALGANGGSTETLALLSGAPEIGAGAGCNDPSATPESTLTVDQRGLPRPLAPAKCDIGAFQDQLPVNSVAPALSGTAEVGQALSCTQGTWAGDGPLSPSDVVGPLSFAYQWLRAGMAITGASAASYTAQAADVGHPLSCQVTATGAYGNARGTSAQSASVAAASPGAGTPTVSAFSQSASDWLEDNLLASVSSAHKPPVGTIFSFRLSKAATVTFTFTRSVSGRKVGKVCVSQTKHNARRSRCTRTVTVGRLILAGAAGANSVHFGGRISAHLKLKPGAYTVVLAATASSHTSATHKLKFTIVKPKPKTAKHKR